MQQIRARGETSPSLRDLGTTVCQTPTPKRQGVSVGKKKLLKFYIITVNLIMLSIIHL